MADMLTDDVGQVCGSQAGGSTGDEPERAAAESQRQTGESGETHPYHEGGETSHRGQGGPAQTAQTLTASPPGSGQSGLASPDIDCQPTGVRAVRLSQPRH